MSGSSRVREQDSATPMTPELASHHWTSPEPCHRPGLATGEHCLTQEEAARLNARNSSSILKAKIAVRRSDNADPFHEKVAKLSERAKISGGFSFEAIKREKQERLRKQQKQQKAVLDAAPTKVSHAGASNASEKGQKRRRNSSPERLQNLHAEFAGTWEIRLGTDPSGIWGQAEITNKGSYFRQASNGGMHEISIEGSLSGKVHLRSFIGDAQLDKKASDVQRGRLRWLLIQRQSGRVTRSNTIWTRLEAVTDSPDDGASEASQEAPEDEIVEVLTDEEKDYVMKLHSAKVAFSSDKKWLRLRIYQNEDGSVQCRSWMLKVGGRIVAAATVRFNHYINREGYAWAQIMNASVERERLGHGTRLIAGLEELLWNEGVDVATLYPVPNNRADNFWTSMGYAENPESLLPAEELDPRNGGLLPEGCISNGVRTVFPRWEKALIRDRPQPELRDDATDAARKRRRITEQVGCGGLLPTDWAQERLTWPLWRKVEAQSCSISGQELQVRVADALERKDRWKDKWMRERIAGQVKAQKVRELSSHPTASTTDESHLSDLSNAKPFDKTQ